MSEHVTEAELSNGHDAETDVTGTFMTLFLAHRHRLYAFIAKQLVNPADVEDVFQKTSLVLWKKAKRFDPNASFFHWACGIAFNEVRNFLSGQKRSKLFFDAELVELIAEEAQEEGELSDARLDALRQCMTSLSDRQRQIVQRCYAGTDNITQLAEKIGQSRGALYKQLARLREKLLLCIRRRLSIADAPQ